VGSGYRITGRKVWVANADAASVAIVFACTREGLRGQGVTAFLVPMDTAGVTRRARADSLGVRGLGCQDLDLDIEVGDDQVLGSVDQGFRVAMWALHGGRIAIAAQALGIGEAALDEALAYAKAREVFGQPIANYQAIQWMLADMATELDAARMLTLRAAAEKDRQSPSVAAQASMAKLAASEALRKQRTTQDEKVDGRLGADMPWFERALWRCDPASSLSEQSGGRDGGSSGVWIARRRLRKQVSPRSGPRHGGTRTSRHHDFAVT
jgi:butyryl-CoA dehydrogenase